MREYNPATIKMDTQKGANIAFLKEFLAVASVDELIDMDLADIGYLETLLADSIRDDMQFEKYFPIVAFASYYNDYGQAIHRHPSRKHHGVKDDKVDWSNPQIVAESRFYVRHKLIPSCRKKICDMLSGKAYWCALSDLPQEKVDALGALLENVTPAVI